MTEPESIGTQIAARIRAQGNRWSPDKRARLLARGLRIIYEAERAQEDVEDVAICRSRQNEGCVRLEDVLKSVDLE